MFFGNLRKKNMAIPQMIVAFCEMFTNFALLRNQQTYF